MRDPLAVLLFIGAKELLIAYEYLDVNLSERTAFFTAIPPKDSVPQNLEVKVNPYYIW